MQTYALNLFPEATIRAKAKSDAAHTAKQRSNMDSKLTEALTQLVYAVIKLVDEATKKIKENE